MKNKFTVFFTLALVTASFLLFSQMNGANYQDNGWLQDQQDQTDVYAIPLDSSEYEDNQEIENLEETEQALHREQMQHGEKLD